MSLWLTAGGEVTLFLLLKLSVQGCLMQACILAGAEQVAVQVPNLDLTATRTLQLLYIHSNACTLECVLSVKMMNQHQTHGLTHTTAGKTRTQD